MNKELLLEYAAELAKTNTTIETYYKQYLLCDMLASSIVN